MSLSAVEIKSKTEAELIASGTSRNSACFRLVAKHLLGDMPRHPFGWDVLSNLADIWYPSRVFPLIKVEVRLMSCCLNDLLSGFCCVAGLKRPVSREVIITTAGSVPKRTSSVFTLLSEGSVIAVTTGSSAAMQDVRGAISFVASVYLRPELTSCYLIPWADDNDYDELWVKC